MKKSSNDWATRLAKRVMIFIFIAGLIFYGTILIAFVTGNDFAVDIVKEWPPKAFDVPMAGLAAFAVVSLLESKTDEDLEFQAFSLKFTGPAVPATLWIVVFLSIVLSFTVLN